MTMTNQEFKTMIEEGKKRDHERRLKLREDIKKEFPGLEIEGLKEGGSLYTGYRVYLSNLEYVEHEGVYIYKRPTDLGYAIKFAEEGAKAYELIEVSDYKVVMVEEFLGWSVWVGEYVADSGSKLKGKRRTRKVHESSKGRYIELNGKRHYISFLNKEKEGVK